MPSFRDEHRRRRLAAERQGQLERPGRLVDPVRRQVGDAVRADRPPQVNGLASCSAKLDLQRLRTHLLLQRFSHRVHSPVSHAALPKPNRRQYRCREYRPSRRFRHGPNREERSGSESDPDRHGRLRFGPRCGRCGLELAENESAQAVFAHVASIVDLIPEWKEQDASPTRLPRPEEEPALAEALELAKEHGVEARAELLIGYPPRQIAGLAEQIDADCIVVGSRELGRLKRAILGSTSRELLSLANRPVLIVHRAPVREPTPA